MELELELEMEMEVEMIVKTAYYASDVTHALRIAQAHDCMPRPSASWHFV